MATSPKYRSGSTLILRIVQCIPISFAIIPLALIPFGMRHELIVFLVYKFAGGPPLRDNLYLQVALHLLKFLYLTIGITEASRTCAFIIVLGIERTVYFTCYVKEIAQNLKYCGRNRFNVSLWEGKIISSYYQFHLIFQWDKHILNLLAGMFFLALFFMALVANFVTLKMFAIFPFHFYLAFPIFAVTDVIVLVVNGMLLFGVGDVSELMVKGMNQVVGLVGDGGSTFKNR